MRWLLMLAVFRRALELRPYVTDIWQEKNYEYLKVVRKSGANSNAAEEFCLAWHNDMEINDDCWTIITAFTEVLEGLEDVLLTMEGDGQTRLRENGHLEAFGSIWDYHLGMEFLLRKSLPSQWTCSLSCSIRSPAWGELSSIH